ncbi:MAG TPA: hypothetical protein DCF84_00450 [Bacteroidetes bacterium]|nr:hypothetical protein [Bacteroidota bacterium]
MARIAILLPSFTVGGAETQALLLSDFLIHRGHDVMLFSCTQGSNCLDKSLLNTAVVCKSHPVHFQNILHLKPRALRSILSLSRKLVKYKINVIVPFTLVPNILGNLAAKFAGIRLRVWNQRSVDIIDYGRGEQLARRMTHQIIGNSDYVVEKLQARWGGTFKTPFQTIYNGRRPDPKPTDPPPLSLNESQDNTLSILHLASFFEEKDFTTLIMSLKVVVERGLNVHLHLVGRNPGGITWPACRELVSELALGSNVFFHGAINSPQSHIRNADLCILSTKSEGLSNTLIEYALAKKPTLTTNIPPNVELFGFHHKGFFEVGNHIQLANLIEAQAQDRRNQNFVPTLNVPIDTAVMGDKFHQIILAHLS